MQFMYVCLNVVVGDTHSDFVFVQDATGLDPRLCWSMQDISRLHFFLLIIRLILSLLE